MEVNGAPSDRSVVLPPNPIEAVSTIKVFYLFVTVLCETCAIVCSKELV